MASPIVGPVPPYSNPPINPQYYEPSRFVISAITLGFTTLVTTSINHNYVVGQSVRLLIPFGYGAYQLNEVPGNVLSIPNPNQVVLDINSNGSDVFLPGSLKQNPQIVAIGDINSGTINQSRSTLGTFIPGAFIDISPL